MLQKICSLQRMTPPITLDRGLLSASGATVPEDGTDGYQPACYFQDTTNGKIYINEGSVTSCEFNTSTTGGAADTITIGAFASLLKGSGIPLSSTQTSSIVAYGDDNGLAIASSVYNIRSRLLLTVDQDGASIRALMGQLKLATGVDVSTGIYTAVQGYVELAGDTSVETTATFSCIDASLEIASGKTLTVDSGGEACGVHVETTGAGTISATGTCAGILIDKASGAPDWTNGVIVKNSTRGVVLTGITAQAIDIQTSGVFRMGVEGTGIPMSNTYPYGLEIHTKTTTDFAQPATGVSAGIYSRYEHSFDQVTATGHAAVFAKLRVKQDLGDGVHAASYNYVEISGTTIVGGTSTTQTCAGMFAVEAPDTLNLTTGYLCGIVVSSTIGSSATTTGSVLGICITRSGTSHPWDTGIAIEGGSSGVGIGIAACTTAAINITGDQAIGILCDVDADWANGLEMNIDTSMTLTTGIEMSGAGTVTTGITISATACTTGIAISSGSLTDGIKISGATPVDGVDVSSVCSAAAFHVSGTSAVGLLVSGATTTAAINITGDQVIGILCDVDASWTDGLKMSVDTSMTLTDGIEMSGAGTITTGILMNPTTLGTGISVGNCSTAGITVESDDDKVAGYNAIYSHIDTGGITGWNTGRVTASRFKVTLDGSGNVTNVSAIWGGLNSGGTYTGLGQATCAAFEVVTTHVGSHPTAILYLTSAPGTSASHATMPYLVFAENATGTGSNILFEVGSAPAGYTCTTGAGTLYHAETLQIKVNGGARYLPMSTAQTSFTTAYPIILTTTDPATATNGIYSNLVETATWTGSITPLRCRNTITTADAGGNCYGGWFNLLFDSGAAPTGLGLSCGLYVEAGSNVASTGVSSVLMATLLGDADGGIGSSPILTLADASTLKTAVVMEFGFNAGGTSLGTGTDTTVAFRTGGNAATNINFQQGLRVMCNGAYYYIGLIAEGNWSAA